MAVYMQVDEKWHPAPVLRCARTSVYQWWEEHKEEVPKGFFRRTFDPLGVHGVYIYYIYIFIFVLCESTWCVVRASMLPLLTFNCRDSCLFPFLMLGHSMVIQSFP